jgi:excisionase family DNA binding protein
MASSKPPLTRFEVIAREFITHVGPELVERVAELLAERYSGPPPLLTAEGAAKYLAVDNPATVRRWAREGRIPCIRLGDGPSAHLRFDPEALREQLSHPPSGTERYRVSSSVDGSGQPVAVDGKVKANPRRT